MMNKIQLKTGDIVDFNLLPKPKYKVGDVVWIFCGKHEIESVVIEEVDQEVYYFDNGYTSCLEYDIYYTAKYNKVFEQDLYSTKEEVVAAFNKWYNNRREQNIVIVESEITRLKIQLQLAQDNLIKLKSF